MSLKNLNMNDINILRSYGYRDKDMTQIDEAITRTIYLINDFQPINHKTARKILGNEQFLAAIGRSTFHMTTGLYTENDNYISFNSQRMLFR